MFSNSRFYAIIFIFLSTILFAQTTYYVSNSEGNDNNNGLSQSSPIKTINKINNIKLKPGDKVLFRRGDTWNSISLKITNSGTNSQPIIISDYGTGNFPIISLKQELDGWKNSNNWEKIDNSLWRKKQTTKVDRLWLNKNEYKGSGENSRINKDFPINSNYRWGYDGSAQQIKVYSENNPAISYTSMDYSVPKSVIKLNQASYIVISNLNVEYGQFGIFLKGSSNITIKNCNLGYGSISSGVYIVGNGSTFSNSNEISNCTFDSGLDRLVGGPYEWYWNTGHVGVWITNGANYNKVHNCNFKNWHHSSIIVMGNDGKYLEAKYNTIYDNVFTSKDINFGRVLMFAGEVKNKCSYNEFYRNFVNYMNTQIEVGGNHNLIYYNIINVVKTGEDVEHEYYSSASGTGFSLESLYGQGTGYTSNNKIFNNTIFKITRIPLRIYSGVGQEFFNNLIIENIRDDTQLFVNTESNSNTIIKNNLILNSRFNKNSKITFYKPKGYLTVSEFNNAGVGNDNLGGNAFYEGNKNNVVKNASAGDFHLVINSPAINNGILNGISKDFYGNPIKGAPDVGAVEYQGTEEPVLPPSSSKIRVFLQGAYSNGSMLTDLLKEKLLPNSQPYNVSPWNYKGPEKVSGFPSNIVDWILIQLRSTTTKIVATKAVLLRSDGFLTGIANNDVAFGSVSSGDYYLVVYHRNHLPVMSSQKVYVENNGTLQYDFTTDVSKAYGDKALVELGSGKFGMLAGDADGNSIINNLDYNAVAKNIFTKNYQPGDVDMNGLVNVLDYSFINQNILNSSNVPKGN